MRGKKAPAGWRSAKFVDGKPKAELPPEALMGLPTLAQVDPLPDIPTPAAEDPWVHRSKGMRCRSCMFYVGKPSSGILDPNRGPIGRCRRHAPTMNGYPVVYVTDWCGDHKLDESKGQ